jgi:hypothetical protein
VCAFSKCDDVSSILNSESSTAKSKPCFFCLLTQIIPPYNIMNSINIPEWWAKTKIRTKSRKQKLKAFKQLERLCAESERLFEELVRKTQRYDEVVFDAHNEKQTARETIDTLEDQVS